MLAILSLLLPLLQVPPEVLMAVGKLRPEMTIPEVEAVLKPVLVAHGYQILGGTGHQLHYFRVTGNLTLGVRASGPWPVIAQDYCLYQASPRWRYVYWDPSQAEADAAVALAKTYLEKHLREGGAEPCPPGGPGVNCPQVKFEITTSDGRKKKYEIKVGGEYFTHRVALLCVIPEGANFYQTFIGVDLNDKKVVPLVWEPTEAETAKAKALAAPVLQEESKRRGLRGAVTKISVSRGEYDFGPTRRLIRVGWEIAGSDLVHVEVDMDKGAVVNDAD